MSKPGKKGDEGAYSRRDFLRGGAAGAITAGVLKGSAFASTEQSGQEAALLGPGPVPMALQINGKSHRLNLEPRVTLLDALRDHLELTGAKKVCDRGTCGACTVIVGGHPVYSCSILAIEAQGLPVETIEGLSTPDHLLAFQQAVVDHDGSQCGFCTPGFMMACKAMLAQTPNPSEETLRDHLGGNLCRCGTYAGLRSALTGLTGGGVTNG